MTVPELSEAAESIIGLVSDDDYGPWEVLWHQQGRSPGATPEASAARPARWPPPTRPWQEAGPNDSQVLVRLRQNSVTTVRSVPSPELVRRLRRNRGRLLRPEYVSEIAKLLQRPVDSLTLLDLEDTERLDRLVGEVRHRTQGVFHKMFIVLPDRADNGQAAEAWETIRRLCRNIPDEPLVLIRNLSEYCGAVEVRLSEVCEHAAELATWNQEQLRATRKDGSAGLVLYLHVDRPGFKQPTEEVYDLWIWGDDWIDAVTSATGTMD